MRWFSRLSFKNQILIAIASIGFFVFIGFGIAIGVIVKSRAHFEEVAGNKISLLGDVLALDRTIQNLLLHTRLYVATKQDTYLQNRQGDEKELRRLWEELAGRIETSQLQTILESNEKLYRDLFTLLQAEGDHKTGLHGEMRHAIKEIEDVLAKVSFKKDAVELAYLSIRDDEKDYFTRRETKYVGKVAEGGEALLKLLRTVITPQDWNVIQTQISTYNQLLLKISQNHLIIQELQERLDKEQVQISQNIHTQREALRADVDGARAEVQRFFITAAVTLALFVIFLFALFALVIVSVFKLTGSLESTSRSVINVLAKATEATQSMREIANQTSRASIEQATAIQETVATLNEITSMARSTQENVIRSANSANRSASTTQTGVQRMDDMLSIVSKIEHSVSDLSQAIDENNQKMREVIRTVNNIQQESRAIEDIAFNTRIISFNAAVEAARAGQAGLSFKVVAEEVNNLAVQSSESARRIKEIMAQSSQQVAQIVEQTTESSTQFVSKSNEHTAVGVEISEECRTIMRHVLDQVLEVKSNMDAIGSANEQVTEGVANINKAMQDLDVNTSIGSDMAARTAELADELSAQTLLAMESMQKLETRIFGGAAIVQLDSESQGADQDQVSMTEVDDELRSAS